MRLTEIRNKLKIEETNKNRNATCVRNDSVKKEDLLNTLFPRENEEKNEAGNTKHFLKNTNIFTRHCACDKQNLKSRAFKLRNVSLINTRGNLYVVLHKDFSHNI